MDDAIFRSKCPLASALDLLGDKWTLVVVRDLLVGLDKFGDMENSLERIPTNILSDRLKKLESYGIVIKEPYQTNPVRNRYKLTDRGKDLAPVLGAIARWGEKHIEGRWIIVGEKDAAGALAQIKKRLDEKLPERKKHESVRTTQKDVGHAPGRLPAGG